MADEGFLQRWSRRKAEAREPSEQSAPPAQEPAPQRATAPEVPDPQAPAPAEARARDADAPPDLDALPDIETLTYESDFTAFMGKGVPPELRKRALQRLWRSHPTLANLDGLVEYGEDYTKIGTAKQVVRTAYQVGRGMLRRIDAEAAQEAPAPAGAAGSAGAQRPPSAPEPVERASDPPAKAADEAAAMVAARPGSGSAPARDERSGEPSAPANRPRPLPRRG
jgi:hypothetical protein